MRAVVMRNSSSWSPTSPSPSPGPGEVLVRTLACGICGSDLHALPPRRAVRRGIAPRRQPARHGPRARRRHGPRVLRGDRRSRARDDAGAADRHARVLPPHAGARDGPAEHRLLERQSRRLRRVHAAHGGAAARGAERSVDRARGAHRADGRRRPCGRQGPARAGRRAAGDRLRSGRARGDRRAAPAGVEPIVAADFSPLRRELAVGSAPTSSSIPPAHAVAELARGGGLARCRTRATASAVDARAAARPPWCSSASASPASSTRSWRRRRAARASWSWACAWSRTRSTRCSASTRS